MSFMQLNPWAAQAQNRTSTVAIAPLAGRVCYMPLGKTWTKCERKYTQTLSTAACVIPSSLVVGKLSGDEEFIALYHELLLSLADLPVQLSGGIDGVSCRMSTKPWDGMSGINYTNLVRIYGDSSEGNSYGAIRRNGP